MSIYEEMESQKEQNVVELVKIARYWQQRCEAAEGVIATIVNEPYGYSFSPTEHDHWEQLKSQQP